MLGGVVLLCHPLLVPGLVSVDPSPIGRSLEVGGILLFPLLNLNLSAAFIQTGKYRPEPELGSTLQPPFVRLL